MHTKSRIVLKLILWLLPAVFFFKDLHAQSYIADVRKLSVEDGLSNRFTTSICIDSRGFIWIATRYGLNRYDGYGFKHYTKENSDLSTDDIKIINEDTQQRLWILHNKRDSQRSIDILDINTGRIEHFDTVFNTRVSFKPEFVANIYADAEKTLWIRLKSGKIYRYKDKEFDHITTFRDSKRSKIIYASGDFLWLSHKNSVKDPVILLRVDNRSKTIKRFTPPASFLLFPVGMDDQNNLWFFNPKRTQFLKTDEASQEVLAGTPLDSNLPEFGTSVSFANKCQINISREGFCWFLGTNKFRKNFPVAWDFQKNTNYNFEDKIIPLLSYKKTELNTSDACLDKDNRLWLATDDGVFILSLKKNKFTAVTAPNRENYSSRGIVEDHNGIVYISTYSGTLKLHPEKGVMEMNRLAKATAITKDNEGKLWFDEGKFTVQYDPVTGKSRYYSHNDTLGQSRSMKKILMRHTNSDIWVGTEAGLYTIEPKTGRLREFMQYNKFPELKESSIYYLQQTREGIWLATSTGLYLLDPGKRGGIRYSNEQAPPYAIPYDHILHFHRDSEGIFWLATKGGGLIRFDSKDSSSRQFTTKDGLSNNIIYAVYEDDYGKLWLPSNYGLMQFDKKNYQVNTYLESDGIAYNEFNTGSHYRASDRRLYFGGLAGVTVFHPKDFIAEAPAPAPLRITSCQVLNTKTDVLTDQMEVISNAGELVLSPSDKSVIITFALLNYQNTEKNTYVYKIEGLDNDWNTISGNNLRLNNLPYGRYVLRIKGQGIGGEQSANTLHISLRVRKPFYLTIGFMLSCMVALALLIYGMFRWRLQRLRKAKRQLQKTVRQRTQEIQQQKDKIEKDKNTIEQQAEELKALNTTQSRWFTNIAHELRTPLTLIAGPVRQLLKTTSGKTKTELAHLQLVEKNSGSLLKLVNQIMDVSRMESGQIQLQKESVQLHHLVEVSVANFESFARQKGVRLTSHIQVCPVILIDKERIQNIIVNLIANALKFTHAGGRVAVSLAYTPENGVTISVSDIGDGIPERDLPHIFERYYQASDPKQVNQGGAGIGLALALELARLHGGDIIVESQVGKGSVFTLLLPETLVVRIEQPQPPGQQAIDPKTLAELPNVQHNRREDKAHILLVEDNPDMRTYIKSFMTPAYALVEAADGLQALEYLKKNTPDLVISDIMMPRMDGITLAKTLKNDERLKMLPFITLTARTNESGRIEALRIGIDDYLTKPFNAEELKVRVANLIRNYKARQSGPIIPMDGVTESAHHEKLITAMKAVVMGQLKDTSFSTHDLAVSQHMSPSTLQRFLKKNTGLSPIQFIREIRLQYARKLLEAQQHPTLSEVIYAVGFKNKSYFVKLFTARFGKKPSEYL